MSRLRHASQDVKALLIWESEIPSNQLEAEVVSVNNSCKPFICSDTTRNPPARFPDYPFPPVASCKSSTMDAGGTYANELGAALPAVANLSSRDMSRLASKTFVRGSTSALMRHIDSSEGKQTGRATGLEVVDVKSELEVLDIQGDKHHITRTAPNGGFKTRSMERQAGHRSRFRPWGYI